MDTQKLIFLLKACTTSKSLTQGKLLHQKVITLGQQSNIYLCKQLVIFYSSCRSFESAGKVFQSVDNPLDISLWNGLIAAYTKNRMYNEALHLFEKLQSFPYVKPDNFTYPSVLKVFTALGYVRQGRKIHTHVIKLGFGFDVVVSSALVGLYAKCDLFDSATRVFDEMPERDVPSWNAVISCYYQSGESEKALELFEEMRKSGFEPDSVSFTTAFSACARLLDLERGKEIHEDLMRCGFEMDGFVSAALVDMYGKCGCLDMAREVFEQIPKKSVVSWNSMISAYGSICNSDSCIELFRRMNEERMVPTSTTISSLLTAFSRSARLREGKFIHGFLIRGGIETDIFINCSLVDLYIKCGSLGLAERVFKMTPKTNEVSWNVMISGYVTVGLYFEALRIFSDMKSAGVRPDAITFTSVLTACSQIAALEHGREIHESIIESKLERSEIVMGALLDMYSKCGAVDEARRVFDQLPERDFVSWTSMITAYGTHGQAFEALELFQKMEKSKAKPDKVTFLAILSACSHGGLVDEGCYYFEQMKSQYKIHPTLEHYSCLLDLLGRAGRLREAYEILLSTPSIRNDVGLLSTLFSACNMHRDVKLGEEIAKFLMKEDPDDPSTYVVLSNMYASVGRWDEVRKVRLKMRDLGLKKSPGCSWIEIDKKIHSFFVEDKSHPHAEMMYECLADLMRHMEEEEPSTFLG